MGNVKNIILYSTPQGNVNVQVVFNSDTFWLTQKAMSQLFAVDVPAISKHLANIFDTHELQKDATISILETVQQEGSRNVKRNVEFYRLEAVLAVGYRVNSSEATQFRIWATDTLKEFITKGFILDDERLKQGKDFGKDYFDELLERIREIRASERRFYQKITIYMPYQSTITKKRQPHRNFSLRYKINYIGLSQVKPLPKSSILKLMPLSYLWA